MIELRHARPLAAAALMTVALAGSIRGQLAPRPLARVTSADTLLLTLVEARRLALMRNPTLGAERQSTEAALGRLRQARVYPLNPEISFRSERLGSGRTFDGYEGEVSQEIEWAGQWGLRIDAAERRADGGRLAFRDAARLTLASVSTAFYRALAAESRLNVAEEIEVLSRRLVETAIQRLEAGAVSEMETNLARVEAGRARTRVLTEQRNARTARLDLLRVMGLSDSQSVRLVGDGAPLPDAASLDPDSLVRVALARRPDAGAARADVAASETLIRLAGRDRLPTLRLSVPFDRLEGPGSGQVGLGLGVSIPLWNRNQGTLHEQRAEAGRARFTLDAAELTIRTEVLDAVQRFGSASEEERVAREEVRDPARRNQALLDEAFRSGKIDLTTVLLLRNELLDAELAYWDSWLELRLEFVRLDAAIAQPFTTDDEEGR